MPINRIVISGNLSKDVEIRKAGEYSVAKFSVAVPNYHKKNDDGEATPDYFECEVWRKTAEFLGKYAKKGDFVVVTGSMVSDIYQDKDGNNRKVWKVQADTVELRTNGAREISNSSNNDSSPKQNETGTSDDELPF
jgi:single-strand DNA-binding protein